MGYRPYSIDYQWWQLAGEVPGPIPDWAFGPQIKSMEMAFGACVTGGSAIRSAWRERDTLWFVPTS